MALAYTRALLKISGEALAGDKGFGLDYHMVEAFAEEIKAVHALGVHLSLVVGGGNIIRGTAASREGLDRVSADYMGCSARSSTPWRCRMCWRRSGWIPGS